ncbi:MAG: vWA domain-containing protein [Roseiflexaceae bacterium]
MRRCILLFCMIVLLLAHPGQPAVGQAPPSVVQVEVLAVANNDTSVTVDFQAWDADGRAVLGLDKTQIQIVENSSSTVAIEDLRSYTTEQTPTLPLALSDGKPYTLTTIGATIGIVFDAATALGPANLKGARQAIQQFLFLAPDYQHPRALAPAQNPEYFSLFIPLPGDQQRFQPAGFERFINDPNAVWNYIDRLTPIRGATPLNGALQQAVRATAVGARERHGRAVVLVVSDGRDQYTNFLFADNLKQAQERAVQLIIFGIGSATNLEKGWGSLKNQIDQYNIPYYPNPDPATIEKAFSEFAVPAPAGLFRVRYTTRLALGGSYKFAVQVSQPGSQPISSAPPFDATFNAADPAQTPLQPSPAPTKAVITNAPPQAGGAAGTSSAAAPRQLSSVLVPYFLLAGAIAVLAAILVVSAVGLATSRSLDRAPTKR